MENVNETSPSIGLIELPWLKMIDPDGKNWAVEQRGLTLVSKQILLADLRSRGFDAQLVNLRDGADDEEVYGYVDWKGMRLTKTLVGTRIATVDPQAFDVWGITVNFMKEREAACAAIRHLTAAGKPVIVGGSDVFAEPQHYLQAGASAVVIDKSGGANAAILNHLLGNPSTEPLTGTILADGTQYPVRKPVLGPEAWALPTTAVAQSCLGYGYYYDVSDLENLYPQGSVFSDIGCDRKCDFCQTPTYRLGYQSMTPQRVHEWAMIQKEAGAGSVQFASDQFLGRILWEGGRDEILEIVKNQREIGLPFCWNNGLELRKATIGRGFNRETTDLTPDEELVNALWGWDGKNGCFEAFIPAERPIAGRENYAKLLPWQQHCAMLKAIVSAGVPWISYGLIIGFSDESDDSLLYLEEAVTELVQALKAINPKLNFHVRPNAISVLPGTPQSRHLKEAGFLRVEDPTLLGSGLTACADTNHLSYEEISDWQLRLMKTGTVNTYL